MKILLWHTFIPIPSFFEKTQTREKEREKKEVS